jgi:hypothetical protein
MPAPDRCDDCGHTEDLHDEWGECLVDGCECGGYEEE